MSACSWSKFSCANDCSCWSSNICCCSAYWYWHCWLVALTAAVCQIYSVLILVLLLFSKRVLLLFHLLFSIRLAGNILVGWVSKYCSASYRN
ncbi:hypothetical protein GBAR_LOCUS25194, partial [Geodia barretti]